MNRTSAIVVLAVTILVAFPVAGADWMAYGSYEPDTVLDTPSYMWQDRPGTIKDRIYFNGFATSGPGLGGANGEVVNPNVGMLRTNIDPQGDAAFEAVLGVWTDCNGDGYIGMLETAVREYDARLLPATPLCPALGGPKNAWTAGANNYNGWVTELIPIFNSPNADGRSYIDPNVRVWLDEGKPNDAAAHPGTQCRARARGEAHTTGGIIWQADCQGNGVGIRPEVGAIGFDTGDIIRVPLVATFNEVDGTAGTGLGFGNDPAHSSSPLNQKTFGDDHSSNSAVYAGDCNAAPIYLTQDVPVGSDLDHKSIRPIPAQPVNPNTNSWTVPGTLNATFETITLLPKDQNVAQKKVWSTSNCDYNDDAGQDFYRYLETEVDIPPYNGKDGAFSNFAADGNGRGQAQAAPYPAGNSVGITNGNGRGGVPVDLGIDALGVRCSDSACPQGNWMGGVITYTSPVLKTRFDIEDAASTSADLPSARWWTYYARVGAAMKDYATPGGEGEYGSFQCDAVNRATSNWNCDPDAWYLRSDGTYPPVPPHMGGRAVVGMTYQLRDVDCWDGRVTDEIGAAAAYYGPAPCVR